MSVNAYEKYEEDSLFPFVMSSHIIQLGYITSKDIGNTESQSFSVALLYDQIQFLPVGK